LVLKKEKTKSKAVVEKETVIIYTEQEAETSKETRVIAGFIKQNPGHARNDYFKKRLMEIIMADNSPEAKPTIKPISREKIENIVKNNELNSGKVIAANKKSEANTAKNTDKIDNAVKALKEERLASYASVGAAKAQELLPNRNPVKPIKRQQPC
jgi:chorismate mutase